MPSSSYIISFPFFSASNWRRHALQSTRHASSWAGWARRRCDVWLTTRVGLNHTIYIVYIRCTYDVLGREITNYTVIYGYTVCV